MAGRREQPLRQFELRGQMLREEHGLEPAEKTLRLAEEIREGLLV